MTALTLDSSGLMPAPLPSRRRASKAFSLPEVTMAVGIASMAIVLLLGLVPTGLNSLRDAAVSLAEARIFQQISGEIQNADWGQASGGGAGALSYTLLPTYNDTRRFFDDQGTPLTDTQATNSLRLAYVARIRLNANSNGVAVPGGQISNNMVLVTIDIAAVPDANFSFGDDFPFKSRTFVVTRQF